MKQFLLGLSFAALLAFPANAAVIFSNIGPNNSFQWGAGWSVGAGGYSPANGFVSPGDFNLGQIDVALTRNPGTFGTNSAVVSLWGEKAGLPDGQLGSWTVSGQPYANPFDVLPLTTISGISGIYLNANTMYFLVIAPGAFDTQDGWNLNSIGVQGTVVLRQPDGSWDSKGNRAAMSAFALFSNERSVPEPVSISLFGAGIIGGVALRRRRKAR